MSQSSSSSSSIQALIEQTRNHIADGSGKDALETLIRAIVANTGEASVIPLLAQLNQDMSRQRELQLYQQMENLLHHLQHDESILQEYGDEDILIDAFQDGSSVICQKCQGLIKVDRAEEHAKYWCPMAEENSEAEDEDEEDN